MFEGGVKSTAFVTGGYLPDERRGEEMNALMHITDWLPTLTSMLNIDLDTSSMDGFDQSINLLTGVEDEYYPRQMIVHNILSGEESGCNVTTVCGAIRWRNYKLVIGNEAIRTGDDICMGSWCENTETSMKQHSITCSEDGDNYQYPSVDTHNECPYNGAGCLYDISVDPCEWSDIREKEPEVYTALYDMLLTASDSAEYPLSLTHPGKMDEACPLCHGGFWSPWVNTSNYTTINGESFEFMVEDTSKIRSVSKKHSWHLMRQYMHSLLPAF